MSVRDREPQDLKVAETTYPFVTRKVFLMKNRGVTDQEIAAVLEIPLGTVAQKYSRVKEKLRRLLNENISGRKTRFGQS